MEQIGVLQIISAVTVVLSLLVITVITFRQIGARVRVERGNRLDVIEYRKLDKLRSMVLVRRDDQVHLLMIGGPQDLAIETNIAPSNSTDSEPPSAHRIDTKSTPGNGASMPTQSYRNGNGFISAKTDHKEPD